MTGAIVMGQIFSRNRRQADRNAADGISANVYLTKGRRAGLGGLQSPTSALSGEGSRKCTAAIETCLASGEVRSDPWQGRAVVKQNDKQAADRERPAHRFSCTRLAGRRTTVLSHSCRRFQRDAGRQVAGERWCTRRNETRTETASSRRTSSQARVSRHLQVPPCCCCRPTRS
jgi:hypothetical protein